MHTLWPIKRRSVVKTRKKLPKNRAEIVTCGTIFSAEPFQTDGENTWRCLSEEVQRDSRQIGKKFFQNFHSVDQSSVSLNFGPFLPQFRLKTWNPMMFIALLRRIYKFLSDSEKMWTNMPKNPSKRHVRWSTHGILDRFKAFSSVSERILHKLSHSTWKHNMPSLFCISSGQLRWFGPNHQWKSWLFDRMKILWDKFVQNNSTHVETIILTITEDFLPLFARAGRRKSCRTCRFSRNFWATFWLLSTQFGVKLVIIIMGCFPGAIWLPLFEKWPRNHCFQVVVRARTRLGSQSPQFRSEWY